LLVDYYFNFKSGNFFDNLDGTITSADPNVIWMKCPQGKNWSEIETNTCIGGGATYKFCESSDNHCSYVVSKA